MPRRTANRAQDRLRSPRLRRHLPRHSGLSRKQASSVVMHLPTTIVFEPKPLYTKKHKPLYAENTSPSTPLRAQTSLLAH